MYLQVDLSTVPPVTTLRDPDNFREFKVVVSGAEHAFVPVSALRSLAGERADDAQWQAGLEQMLAFAAEHGWLNQAGDVRAHIERD